MINKVKADKARSRKKKPKHNGNLARAIQRSSSFTIQQLGELLARLDTDSIRMLLAMGRDDGTGTQDTA